MADTPAVNQPSSGTYGEKADINRLKASLPAGAVGQPAPAPAPPPVSPEPIAPPTIQRGRPDTGAAAPPGVPSVLLGPTQQPNVPASTPLATGPATPGAVAPDQQRLAVLDALAHSPDVSATTREWAKLVIDRLLGNRG